MRLLCLSWVGRPALGEAKTKGREEGLLRLNVLLYALIASSSFSRSPASNAFFWSSSSRIGLPRVLMCSGRPCSNWRTAVTGVVPGYPLVPA